MVIDDIFVSCAHKMIFPLITSKNTYRCPRFFVGHHYLDDEKYPRTPLEKGALVRNVLDAMLSQTRHSVSSSFLHDTLKNR